MLKEAEWGLQPLEGYSPHQFLLCLSRTFFHCKCQD